MRREQVMAGGRFSDVMAAYPWIFQPMQIELVRAAELGGMLDQVLLQMPAMSSMIWRYAAWSAAKTLYPKLSSSSR